MSGISASEKWIANIIRLNSEKPSKKAEGMTPGEFKKLPDGCTLVWNGSDSLRGMSGTLHINGDGWVVKWEKGFPCAGTFLHIQEYSDWLSHVGLRTLTYTGPIPSGYESTGEFRIPTPEDCYLRSDGLGVVHPGCAHTLPIGPRLILRSVTPPWVAPKWMKPGCWLWSNDGEIWHLSHNRPVVNGGCYSGLSHCVSAIIAVVWDAKGFTPPPFTGWKESLRQIPESAT